MGRERVSTREEQECETELRVLRQTRSAARSVPAREGEQLLDHGPSNYTQEEREW